MMSILDCGGLAFYLHNFFIFLLPLQQFARKVKLDVM